MAFIRDQFIAFPQIVLVPWSIVKLLKKTAEGVQPREHSEMYKLCNQSGKSGTIRESNQALRVRKAHCA